MSCDHRYRVVPVEGKQLTGQLQCRLCGDIREGDLLIEPTEADIDRHKWETRRLKNPEFYK